MNNSILTFDKDKKDYEVIENFKLMRASEKESFKLFEKIHPKKTRTKYTKEQVIKKKHFY